MVLLLQQIIRMMRIEDISYVHGKIATVLILSHAPCIHHALLQNKPNPRKYHCSCCIRYTAGCVVQQVQTASCGFGWFSDLGEAICWTAWDKACDSRQYFWAAIALLVICVTLLAKKWSKSTDRGRYTTCTIWVYLAYSALLLLLQFGRWIGTAEWSWWSTCRRQEGPWSRRR